MGKKRIVNVHCAATVTLVNKKEPVYTKKQVTLDVT